MSTPEEDVIAEGPANKPTPDFFQIGDDEGDDLGFIPETAWA